MWTKGKEGRSISAIAFETYTHDILMYMYIYLERQRAGEQPGHHQLNGLEGQMRGGVEVVVPGPDLREADGAPVKGVVGVAGLMVSDWSWGWREVM